MKCMKCGMPIDDLSYYCVSCRSEFYWSATTPEPEKEQPNLLNSDIGTLMDNLAEKDNFRDSRQGWRKMISYLLLKYKLKKIRAQQTSEPTEPDDTDG